MPACLPNSPSKPHVHHSLPCKEKKCRTGAGKLGKLCLLLSSELWSPGNLMENT